MKKQWIIGFCALLAGGTSGACNDARPSADDVPEVAKTQSPLLLRGDSGYNLHLENTLRFDPVQPGSDIDRGRAFFGLAPDLVTEDKSQALFEGDSQIHGGQVLSNQRTCFTCHRGKNHQFGLPSPPLSDTVPLDDALFAGMQADAQGDPDAEHNLDQLGLIKYRPNRFNPQRDASDPFRQVFFWRKSQALVNVGLSHGFLNDLRARNMFETARGAVFSHTQESDRRFDDLFATSVANDLEAFMFDQLSDPRLAALRDLDDPMHDTLRKRPFYTVEFENWTQIRGAMVFARECMACHNTPNVFNNRANVKPLGAGSRPVTFPSFAPSVGKAFNIGVSERNKHGLRFTRHVGDGEFETIVLSLAEEDGSIREVPVDMDIGLAATTRRVVDIGRFKVPQLRDLAELAPYFHDNSEDSIEGVVDYFLSDWYASSPAGQRFPIHMTQRERADLIEFLYAL